MKTAWFCLVIGVLLLAGCASAATLASDVVEDQEVTLAPTITFVPSPTPSPRGETATTKPLDTTVQCAWNWAEQPLPEVSTDLTRALQAAGMEGVEAHASAFGENCITGPDNTVDHFAAMQTDFRLSIPVEKLSDTAELGRWVEQVMPVIDSIPADTLQGPNPGQVFIRFQGKDGEVNLTFSRARAKTLLAEGKTSSALYDALHVP